MSTSLKILLIYVVWFAAIYYVQRVCKKTGPGSVGIPLAYLFTMTFIHICALVYVIPGYTHLRMGAHWYLERLNFTEEMVVNGAFASLLSVLGLAVGCYLCSGKRRAAAPPQQYQQQRQQQQQQRPQQMPPPPRRRPPPKTMLPMLLLGGAMAGFVLTAFNITLPSMQSIIYAGRNLAIVAVCLGLLLAAQRNDKASLRFWAVMTLAVPAAYLVGWGFFSYGFMAMSVFLAMWLCMPEKDSRARLAKFAFTALAIYASFSLFVGYMEVRQNLRNVLWSSDADFVTRASTVIQELSKARPFNPFNFSQMDWINIRLNQNMFIGKAMLMHELNPALRENGLAILVSLVAWVPRFLWPNKPVMGGNDFVEYHTGMSFSDSAAIGAGPVFELFVNFGLFGIFFGSIVLGWLLRWMDAYCARQMQRRDIGRFVRGFLVSVCLINPYNLIFFFVSSAGASWVLGTGIMYLMDLLRIKKDTGRPPPRRPQPDKQIWAS